MAVSGATTTPVVNCSAPVTAPRSEPTSTVRDVNTVLKVESCQEPYGPSSSGVLISVGPERDQGEAMRHFRNRVQLIRLSGGAPQSQKVAALGLALIPLLIVGCGGNDSTGPSKSIPTVAGNYSGTTTFSFPELATSLSCPTATTVTQSGSTVSIAPLQLGGPCAANGLSSLPVGSTSIDNTGAIGSESGSTTEACGVYNWTGSGGFFGRDLRLSLVYTSRTCYNMNVTINLSR